MAAPTYQTIEVTQEAVEAACAAHIPLFWGRLEETVKVEGRKQMRAALEAAAPFLAAPPVEGGKIDAAQNEIRHFLADPASGYVNGVSKKNLQDWLAALSASVQSEPVDSEALFDWLQEHHKSVGVTPALREAWDKYHALHPHPSDKDRVAELERERDEAREYGAQARLREKAAEDARVHAVDALAAIATHVEIAPEADYAGPLWGLLGKQPNWSSPIGYGDPQHWKRKETAGTVIYPSPTGTFQTPVYADNTINWQSRAEAAEAELQRLKALPSEPSVVRTALDAVRSIIKPDSIIVAADIKFDRFERKEIFNALTYLTRTGELAHIGYGKYQSPPEGPTTRGRSALPLPSEAVTP